jgi:hypothetical protein
LADIFCRVDIVNGLADFLSSLYCQRTDGFIFHPQRIYNHPPHPTLTIDEVLALLKEFQVSRFSQKGGEVGFSQQGCQFFWVQTYQNEKYIPNVRELYQMAVKYSKWS